MKKVIDDNRDIKYIGNVKIKGSFLIIKPKETYEHELKNIITIKTFLGLKYDYEDFKWVWTKIKNEKEVILPEHNIRCIDEV